VSGNIRILTTGTRSGLGKYLYEHLGGLCLRRDTPPSEREEVRKEGVDVIIHCAFNSSKGITADSLNLYLADNVFLTKELVSIPHKKFIFISSIDVYPKTNAVLSEEHIIDVDSVDGIYGITKLISESIIRNRSSNYLILRASALLGRYSRNNSLIRIIEDKECTLSLSGDSQFNYILHSDVLGFVRIALEQNLTGIYNLASLENITLSEIVNMLCKKVCFGTYRYEAGAIQNCKVSQVFPAFKKTSREVIQQFIEEKK
jgi:nucleoside-diphosphate-sugar epimerase